MFSRGYICYLHINLNFPPIDLNRTLNFYCALWNGHSTVNKLPPSFTSSSQWAYLLTLTEILFWLPNLTWKESAFSNPPHTTQWADVTAIYKWSLTQWEWIRQAYAGISPSCIAHLFPLVPSLVFSWWFSCIRSLFVCFPTSVLE